MPPKFRRATPDKGRAYWYDPERERDAPGSSLIYEPNSKAKNLKWALEQNNARTKRVKKAADAAADAARKASEAAAKAAAPSRWGSWLGRSSKVAPSADPLAAAAADPLGALSTTQRAEAAADAVLAAEAAAAAAATGTSSSSSSSSSQPLPKNLKEAIAIQKKQEKLRQNEAKAQGELAGLRARWAQGKFNTQKAPRTLFNPRSWFYRNAPVKPTFVNRTEGKQQYRLTTSQANRLGRNLVVPRTGLTSYFAPSVPTLDLTDYLAVIADKEGKFTESEKVERFTHLFLLKEILEGKRKINEVISDTERNVVGGNIFSDPKRSIWSFLYAIPRSSYRTLFQGFSTRINASNSKLTTAGKFSQNVVQVICTFPYEVAKFSTTLPVALVQNIYMATQRRSQVGDVIKVIDDALNAARRGHEPEFDAAKLLVEEGSGALNITKAEIGKQAKQDDIEKAVTANFENLYQEENAAGTKGRLWTALEYAEDEKNTKGKTAKEIVVEATREMEYADPRGDNTRQSKKNASAAAAAAAVLAAAAEQAKSEELTRKSVEPLSPVPLNKPVTNAFCEIGVKINKIPDTDSPTMMRYITAVRDPSIAIWSNAALPTERLKELATIYCINKVTPILVPGVAVELIKAEIEKHGRYIQLAIDSVPVNGITNINIINSIKLGALMAFTQDKGPKVRVAALTAGLVAANNLGGNVPDEVKGLAWAQGLVAEAESAIGLATRSRVRFEASVAAAAANPGLLLLQPVAAAQPANLDTQIKEAIEAAIRPEEAEAKETAAAAEEEERVAGAALVEAGKRKQAALALLPKGGRRRTYKKNINRKRTMRR